MTLIQLLFSKGCLLADLQHCNPLDTDIIRLFRTVYHSIFRCRSRIRAPIARISTEAAELGRQVPRLGAPTLASSDPHSWLSNDSSGKSRECISKACHDVMFLINSAVIPQTEMHMHSESYGTPTFRIAKCSSRMKELGHLQ